MIKKVQLQPRVSFSANGKSQLMLWDGSFKQDITINRTSAGRGGGRMKGRMRKTREYKRKRTEWAKIGREIADDLMGEQGISSALFTKMVSWRWEQENVRSRLRGHRARSCTRSMARRLLALAASVLARPRKALRCPPARLPAWVCKAFLYFTVFLSLICSEWLLSEEKKIIDFSYTDPDEGYVHSKADERETRELKKKKWFAMVDIDR